MLNVTFLKNSGIQSRDIINNNPYLYEEPSYKYNFDYSFNNYTL